MAERNAFWYCKFCSGREPAEPPYELGDSEPCSECGEGTAYVLTAEEAEELEAKLACGERQPERSYS